MKTNMKLATIFIFTLLSLFFVVDATAVLYTYDSTDVPKAIPDRGFNIEAVFSTLDVPDSFDITDVDVVVNFSHSQDADLNVYLIAPNGKTVELFTDVGVFKQNFTDTILDDEAATSINDGSAPYTGSYKPEGNLADLNGSNAQGTWKLKVYDDMHGNTGTLNSWGLIFESSEPLPPPPPPPPAETGGITRLIQQLHRRIEDIAVAVSGRLVGNLRL